MNNTYCIFSALYLPHIGGVEKYTYHLARELTALGNKVIIVTNNTEGVDSHENAQEAEIFRLSCFGAMKGRFPVTRKNACTKAYWQIIQAHSVDRVIINTRFYPISLAGVRFAEKLGLTPIVIDHGSAHLTVGNPVVDIAIQRVEHAMTNRMKKHPARYFGVSAKSVEWIRHFGIEGEGVLNNSIDADTFRTNASKRNFRSELEIDEDAFVVSFTGRLAPEKGIQYLVDAAALLEKDGIHVIAGGNGVLMNELAARATSNMHLLGSLESEDVSALLQQCDAFCMPTRSEGFSTSLLEAASCSLALLTTDVGGVDELIPSSDYGCILQDVCPETIALAIRNLANDRNTAQSMGKNVRDRVESLFSWKHTAQMVEKAFDRV